jgi:hypothetical protein
MLFAMKMAEWLDITFERGVSSFLGQCSIIADVETLAQTCQSMRLSSHQFDDFSNVPVSEIFVGNIGRYISAKKQSKVPIVILNYVMYKLSTLPAFAMFRIDPKIRAGFNNSRRSAAQRLRSYRNLSAFFQQNNKNILINSKQIRLSWFRNANFPQLTSNPNQVIPDDFVSFDFLEEEFGFQNPNQIETFYQWNKLKFINMADGEKKEDGTCNQAFVS